MQLLNIIDSYKENQTQFLLSKFIASSRLCTLNNKRKETISFKLLHTTRYFQSIIPPPGQENLKGDSRNVYTTVVIILQNFLMAN